MQWGFKVAIDVFADCVFLVDIMVQMHAAYFMGSAEDGKVCEMNLLCMCVYVLSVYVYVNVYLCTCMCMCVYVYLCAYACVHMCMFTYV